MNRLPPIADDIIGIEIISIQAVLLSIFCLAFSAGRREIAFLALAATAYTWRIPWAVDAS